jgi:hypothetical protein
MSLAEFNTKNPATMNAPTIKMPNAWANVNLENSDAIKGTMNKGKKVIITKEEQERLDLIAAK